MSEERSPYATPESDVEVPLEVAFELADRGARLGGAITDGILVMIAYVPVLYFTITIAEPLSAPIVMLLAGAGGFLTFLAVNGYLLATSGQTVAKRILGIQIVSVKDSEPLPFWKLILLRYLPFFAIAQVPVVGLIVGLVNPLTIFGKEKRCMHDYLAGTKVVVYAAPVEPWVGLTKQQD